MCGEKTSNWLRKDEVAEPEEGREGASGVPILLGFTRY